MYPKRKESPRFQALLIFCVHTNKYFTWLQLLTCSHAKVPSPCKQVRTLCVCVCTRERERERETHTDRTERKRGEGVKKHSILSCMDHLQTVPSMMICTWALLIMSFLFLFSFFFSSFLGYLELRKIWKQQCIYKIRRRQHEAYTLHLSMLGSKQQHVSEQIVRWSLPN